MQQLCVWQGKCRGQMPLVKIRGSESSPKPDANVFVMHLDYLLALLSRKILNVDSQFNLAKAFDKCPSTSLTQTA
jgi:hypothetical protein